jgi:hypothetical protein
MPDRKGPRSTAGEQRAERSRRAPAGDQSPKGTPTDDRHTTETAGGQHKHDQPHTTGHPTKDKLDGH